MIPFWTYVAIGVILGLLGGSFLTVLTTRGPVIWGLVPAPREGLPSPYSLSLPRSHCPNCKTPLGIADLVPVFSFLFSGAKCRTCEARIPPFYFLMELLGGVLGGLAFAVFAPAPAIIALVFLLSLLALAVIDAQTGYLPNAITYPLIGAGLFVALFEMFVSPASALVGAVVGYGVFWLVSTLYRVLRGREGLGLGDAKLLSGIGAFTGIYALPFIVMVGAASALVVILIERMRGNSDLEADTEIRFGPYLAGAGMLVFLAGQAWPSLMPWVA